MKYFRGLVLSALAALMLQALALPGSLRAQGNFVYTNDDVDSANMVSGFSVAPNGSLTPVPGSPFLTGGAGLGVGYNLKSYFASNRATVHGNFLFASNSGSNDVSVFSIDARTGTLSLVEGSPFATGGSGLYGIALSATPDGRFLMAANSESANVSVFSISAGGVLRPIEGSPFRALSAPDGIKVSPDGKFLAVAEFDANQIEMFEIAPDGLLISRGAFPGAVGENVAGVDIGCGPALLYAGTDSNPTVVDGYFISPNGRLTPLPGSPFEPGVGDSSQVVLLGYGREEKDQKSLFVSNQFGATITVFRVAFDGSLSLVAGSPFPMNHAYRPAGMATSQDGRLLYVANYTNVVSVFSVGEDGVLTEVAGSPFPTGQSGVMRALAAFPPVVRRLDRVGGGCSLPAGSGLHP